MGGIRTGNPSFSTQSDIVFFKSLTRKECLQLMKLFCLLDSQRRILGFIGMAEHKIEMLFVHPDH
jgi:putative acetyltransferase